MTADAPMSGVIPCPDCGGKVSLRAAACVHCGWPMDDMAALVRSVEVGTLRSELPMVPGEAATGPVDNAPAHSNDPVSPMSGPLPPPAPHTRLAPPTSVIPVSEGSGGSPGGAPTSSDGRRSRTDGTSVRSAARMPVGVGKGAAKATRAVSGVVWRNPMAWAALVAGLVALYLAFTAYDRGSTIRGMVVSAAVILVTWVLGSATKRRAQRAGVKKPWMVPVSRLLALGSALLLGFAGYAYVRGYLPAVDVPPLPELSN